MTTNDHGHVNNLDEHQIEALKTFWRSLLSAIDSDPSKVVDSDIGYEFMYLCGRENPDVILLRWLRARKWDVSAAVRYMIDTLTWRRDWGVRKLIAEGESALITEEYAIGKMYSMGTDKAGRPITYVHASDHIKGQFPIEATEKLLILLMETSRYLVKPPNEQGSVVIDLDNVTYKNLDYQHIRFMITAMQNNYPECLGTGIVVNAPWSFGVVWNVIKRWLDPVVASKIHFARNLTDITEYISLESLPKRLGGNHENYKFIPSSTEDDIQMRVIREDTEGMKRAYSKHKAAAQEYVSATLRWVTSTAATKERTNPERSYATDQLTAAFIELLPYISTRTHLHRSGDIQETIFKTTYDKIHANINEKTTHF